MISQRWTPFAVLAIGALALAAANAGAAVLGPLPRALAAALALLWIPGELCCRALKLGDEVRGPDRIALCFCASLAVWLPVAAALTVFALPLNSAFTLLAAISFVLAMTASLTGPLHYDGPAPHTDDDHGELIVFTIIATATLALAAWHFTASGSIDRWWYLAYVRSFVDAPAVDFRDPLLGSGNVLGRFAFNPWLLMLAMWSRSAAVDPVWLYERAAPLVLVAAAVSAALFLGRSLFRSPRMAWLTAIASCLLWASGFLFPLVTRAPEDKLLALFVVAPTLLAVLIHSVSDCRARWAVLLGCTAAVLTTLHALVYAVVLASALPFVLLTLAGSPSRRSAAAVSLAILAVAAAAAALAGTAAREGLAATGVLLGDPHHPVIRVHHARQRLIELGADSYLVHPRLLAHPLAILGLGGLAALRRRHSSERHMLVPPSVIGLAVAFVPTLAVAAGSVVFPWMVYRILWAIPFAPLLAIFIDESARLTRARPVVVCIALTVIAAPWLAGSVAKRTQERRQRLVLPASPALNGILHAIAALGPSAIVAAPTELAERLPALTGTRVLAASDRATVVFCASRRCGEARLRANAAITAAMWKPDSEVPTPTHVLYAPGGAAGHYCDSRVHENEQFILCRFRPAPPEPGVRLRLAAATADRPRAIALSDLLSGHDRDWQAECSPPPLRSTSGAFLLWPRPGPWSARPALLDCTLRRRASSAAALWWRPATLRLRPVLGAAVDEFTVAVRAERDGIQRWNLRTRHRVVQDDDLRFALPRGSIDTMRVRVIPTFLPFVKLAELSVTFDLPGAQ